MIWKFFIDGVEIEEPSSWDGEEFILRRSKEYFGLENAYSLTLKFLRKGAQVIRDKYEAFGIDAQLEFKVLNSCDPGAAFSSGFDIGFYISNGFDVVINGVLNCADYSYQNGEVSLSLEESSFTRAFKNRIDTVVSLDLKESLDGNPISQIERADITLRSKAIVQYSELLVGDLNGYSDVHTFTSSLSFNIVYLPFIRGSVQDLPETQELPVLIYFNQTTPFPSSDYQPIFVNTQYLTLSSIIKVTYKVKGTFLNSCPQPVSYGYTMSIHYGFNAISSAVIIPITSGSISASGNNGFSFDVSGSFDMPGNYPYAWIFITIFDYANTAGVPSPSTFYIELDKQSFFKFESETTFPDTNSSVFLIHEALAKISEIITGEKDCFRSDYFGSGNSQPHQYLNTGCQRYIAICNGLNLRNMVQSDGESFPINISFSQLYKMLDAIFCLGMNMYYDISEGRWFIRVEPRFYFYNQTDFITFDNASDIEIKADLTNYFGEFEVGYKKWQLNNGQKNGLDEFNTTRNYVLNNKNGKNKLVATCDAITGGYPIEFTRRQQFSLDSTKDFETDNDIFLICLNRVKVGTNEPGTVSEQNELFPTVNNLISPSTAYNLRISPARNTYRWLRWLKASLPKNEYQKIKFTKGEGNYLMSSIHDADWCEPESLIDEHEDFTVGKNGFDESGNQLITPETISFEYPIDFSIFTLLNKNSNKSIRVNCSDSVIYKGFFDLVSFKPNGQEGGTAKFTLTTTPNNGAAFDSGFDSGFDIVI